jgi:hypothetical protein
VNRRWCELFHGAGTSARSRRVRRPRRRPGPDAVRVPAGLEPPSA